MKTQAGTRSPTLRIGSRLGRALGLVWPLAREGAELIYQFEMPFVVDGSAFAGRFPSFSPTPFDEGIARTLAWYRDLGAMAVGVDRASERTPTCTPIST